MFTFYFFKHSSSSDEAERSLALSILNQPAFPCVDASSRAKLVVLLISQFLATSAARDEALSQEQSLMQEDVCRSCGKQGELLCCDECPATYHVECLEPPLAVVPEGNWICYACKMSNRVSSHESTAYFQSYFYVVSCRPSDLVTSVNLPIDVSGSTVSATTSKAGVTGQHIDESLC